MNSPAGLVAAKCSFEAREALPSPPACAGVTPPVWALGALEPRAASDVADDVPPDEAPSTSVPAHQNEKVRGPTVGYILGRSVGPRALYLNRFRCLV